MSKPLIIYGSTTGNTETTAELIENVLKSKGHTVTLINVADTSPDILKEDHDAIIFGCSTWGEEEIELQDDFNEFYDQMGGISIEDKKVAVFGCGDSSYEYFCGAVDAISDKAKEMGGDMINDLLKIDGEPDDNEDEILSWAERISEQI